MSAEWKAGDVGLTARGRLALRREHNPDGWIDSQGAPWSNDKFPANVRPLVVIDPEDREQVERLVVDYLSRYDGQPAVAQVAEIDYMQAALREFANPTPPRPDEPQNDGAVVEDAEGTRWIRTSPIVSSHLNDWVCSASSTHSGSDRRHWDGIKAVRVLSEGVTP